MAQTLEAGIWDFNKQLPTSILEKSAELFNYFNANANGTITLRDADFMGRFPQTGFFARRDTVARRDQTSSSARTLAGHSGSSFKEVVVSRAINDDQTVSGMKVQGVDPMEYARALGANIAEDILENAFTTALNAALGTTLKASTTYLNKSALSSGYGITIDHC